MTTQTDDVTLTAQDIINRLTTPNGTGGTVPGWVQQLALEVRPRHRSPTQVYDTTAVNFFPEVTVRIDTDQTTRRGHPKPQRRRIDLVALIQPNYKAWEPVAVGIEIKCSYHDLIQDNKVKQYLQFFHFFFLAVPVNLADAAQNRATQEDIGCGLIVIEPETERLFWQMPPLRLLPTDQALAKLYAELLIRPFRLAGRDQSNFFNYEPVRERNTG